MRERLKIEYLAAAGAAGLLIWLLFTRPFIGMADSGDFLRVLMTAGLDYNPAASDIPGPVLQLCESIFRLRQLEGGLHHLSAHSRVHRADTGLAL